ncbi:MULTISPECIES: DNA cytosine methyltransferase [unclassified Nostoc]|uniref:DNA cytosine methyltransferase n=1 Tax=unclassified Nostoc TaxID=2593658 RepID=UPI002AD519BA|nr:DNA cytosine methyltransferase [Nostoc sp. DedQUE03]MDZ7975558.1 DNA cytosine methyltransferase [Nostoc sp. DedQUE03]MDZ8048725.1 DNA cytosine methyltransferase [Nostoc sp. DedQUE02]
MRQRKPAHTAKAGKGIESADDLTAAIAVAEAIRQLQLRAFTLENVPRYQNSQSFAIILDALEQEGYSVDYSVVNMADFGLPQARRRLVLTASKGFQVALPTESKPCAWYEAMNFIRGIYSQLPSARTALCLSR